MDPHEIPGLELDISPALVGVDLVVLIKLFNPGPYLCVELLDLFHSLIGLPTKLGTRCEGSEIKGSARIDTIQYLE